MPAHRRRSSSEASRDGDLFGTYRHSLWDNLLAHAPRRLEFFQPERIVLAAGSTETKERALFVERILKLYPGVRVEECLDTPHNRVPSENPSPLSRHVAGKRTLVFGVHQSSVRLAEEKDMLSLQN